MEAQDILKKGSISVHDDARFKYHIDVLKLFGKDLKAHMKATYKLDDDMRIWFPKLYQNRDFINELLDDGKVLEMNQLPTSTLEAEMLFPQDEPGKRIVFAHVIDSATKDKYYKFVGVFTELTGNMKRARCIRISTSLQIGENGSFEIPS